MFLMWFHALGVLEQYASKRRVTFCPAFHLSVELGPSFLLAPVAVFFSVLAGLLFILIGQDIPVPQNKCLRLYEQDIERETEHCVEEERERHAA